MAVSYFGTFGVGVVSWGLLLIDYINFNMEILVRYDSLLCSHVQNEDNFRYQLKVD